MGVVDRARAWLSAKAAPMSDSEWIAALSGSRRSVSGQAVNETSALAVSATFACVSLIARTVGSLPVRVLQERDGRRVALPDHWLGALLRRPNSWQTGDELVESLTAAMLLHGNGYARIRRAPGTREPLQLLPLHPRRVRVDRTGENTATYYVTPWDGGREERVPAADMLHVRGYTRDGLVGLSVLEAAGDVFGAAQAAQDFAARFWANDATPPLVITYPGKLSDQALERMRKSWRATYGGTQRNNPALLEDGVKVERLGLDTASAQALDARRFSVTEIARIFGVPPHMVGDTDRSTSWGSGIEAQAIGFYQQTLRYWLVRWEHALESTLAPDDPRLIVEFNLDNLLRGDIAARSAAYATMITHGVITPNEARRFENLDPIAGGDQAWRQLNLAPLDAPATAEGTTP